jgi:hypothetical protein
MALHVARAEASMAMAMVAAKAERERTGWAEKALVHLRRYARVAEAPFIIEEARMAIDHEIGAPHDGRAWGPVVLAAQRERFIVKTDQTGPAASSHGTGKPQWVKGPDA